jgi:hypothetical protein
MAYNKIFFAHKRPDETASEGYVFRHIYEGLFQTKHCGDGPYFKVRVSEVRKGKESIYWGWKDFEDEKYKFVNSSKHLVQMCSPCYFEIDIKNGKGKLVNLRLEEICEVK